MKTFVYTLNGKVVLGLMLALSLGLTALNFSAPAPAVKLAAMVQDPSQEMGKTEFNSFGEWLHWALHSGVVTAGYAELSGHNKI